MLNFSHKAKGNTEIETSSPLHVSLQVPQGLSTNCDYVNVGLVITGGTTPYKVLWANGQEEFVYDSGVLTTGLWNVPDQAGAWAGLLAIVEDNKGAMEQVMHSAYITNTWGECPVSTIENISLATQNDIDNVYGQSCEINTTIYLQQYNNWIGSGEGTSFTIRNSKGDNLFFEEGWLPY